MQCLVAELKQEPLLRVHCARLGGGDAKGAAVEALRARQEATMTHARRLRCAQRAHVHRRLKRPSRRRHTANRIATRTLQLPALLGGVTAARPSAHRAT